MGSNVSIGVSGGGSSVIPPSMWLNGSCGTATSAIWKIAYRLRLTIFARISTTFSRRLVSDQYTGRGHHYVAVVSITAQRQTTGPGSALSTPRGAFCHGAPTR